MKKILIILISILPIITFGQKALEGKYCSPQDYIGFCIEFNNDSTFIYNSWTCLSNDVGTGKYKINSRQLILKFDSTENFIANRHEIENIKCQSRDSINLIFKVYDSSDSIKLPFANIVFSQNKFINYADSIDFGKATDTLGIAEFKLLKQSIDKWVTVTYVGFKDYSFKINLMNCHNVEIYMNPYNFWEIENETFTYDIKKINKNKIVIIDQESKNKILLKRTE